MLYTARWKRITVDQSKVLKLECSVFLGHPVYGTALREDVNRDIHERIDDLSLEQKTLRYGGSLLHAKN